jgi:site-specific DNA-methyltransferase (adenine-specific)
VPGATLLRGECLPALRAMPDASVSCVVTDPPYGLSDIKSAEVVQAITAWASGDRERVPDGRGFMGNEWDRFVPPAAVWDECLRVLKPGGYMAVFAGARTADLMGLSIRLAGFEIKPAIYWLYGCLTADTEVLTEQGWKLGIDVAAGERVAQWRSSDNRISLAPVLQTYRAPWDGPMRVLRNADTDQVLTPNHRVYNRQRQRKMINGDRQSWYDEQWKVSEAKDISTWNPVQLPVAGLHDGPGIGGTDYAALLGWMWTEGGFDHSGTGVRLYQSSVNDDKVQNINSLLDRLGVHKRYDYSRKYTRRNGALHNYTATTWYISGKLANQVRADLPGKRPTYALLWRMTLAEKEAFLRAALLGDGHVDAGGTWQFYQKHEDDLIWLQTLLAMIGQSGKVGMRPDRPGGAVYIRNTDKTELQSRHLRNSSENYFGEVWCIKVPTGAFVARRNGKVFITGNSGFPKSLDVGKAIDKAAGAEREVIGIHRRHGGGSLHSNSMAGPLGTASSLPLTAPATKEAKKWEGWGTALKPAGEPIIVARKPFPGTVAANVLAHGTGGMNIDRCRVGDEIRVNPAAGNKPGGAAYMMSVHGMPQNVDSKEAAGRWPANVVLSHGEECELESCVEGCPVAELDRQSGATKSLPSRRRLAGSSAGNGQTLNHFTIKEDVVTGFTDEGGASRFFNAFRYQAKAPKSERPVVNGVAHPTVKPLALMEWLVTLFTPPYGMVLDPFTGTGTTGHAALKLGFNSILIERCAQYWPLIDKRFNDYLDSLKAEVG